MIDCPTPNLETIMAGPTKQTHAVALRVPLETYTTLQEIAERTGVPVYRLILNCITSAANKYKETKDAQPNNI